MLTDCLLCVVHDECLMMIWLCCAMKLKEYLQILTIMVPKECLLIVHTVLYLKKVNWSNIVTKCPLHPKKNFGHFRVFWVFRSSFQSHLAWTQSQLASSPPHENNIFHLAWKNSQKKSRRNSDSINKVTLYESPMNLWVETIYYDVYCQ